MDGERLSDLEKRMFQDLQKEQQPPEHLEEKVVAKLKEEGQLRKTMTMKVYVKWAASIAAGILLFLSGNYYGKSNNMDRIEIEPDRGYMLLLHEDERFQPGEPMTMFEEYKAWMENTFNKGVKITGQELKNEAVLVNPDGRTQTLNEGSGKRTTGYFLVEAASLDDAIQVAQETPHVKYGGIVEVKPYMVR